jgi:hypothetical protein
MFGSKITDAGKQAKACNDARRVAVVMPHQLDGSEQMLMLLRVPQSSLKNMKNYVDDLDRKGLSAFASISRLAFDYQEAYPKLVFQHVHPLTEAQSFKAAELADAPNTRLMLQAPDFEGVASHPVATGSLQAMPVQAPPVFEDEAPASAPVFAEPAAATIITLPDGKKFNTATGQYVEEVKAKEPELDPMTIALPTGQFFSQRSNTFVTGLEMGAPAALPATEAPAPKKRGPKKAAAEQPVQQAAIPMDEEQAEEQEEVVSQHTNSSAKPAPRGMEDLLAVLVPPSH